ncbi:MAG: uridine kinase [Candidatus Neomarinimicrobiota bacterium]|nr:uridine kinase [Candidatus Neomarinimicrobiota bacterium]
MNQSPKIVGISGGSGSGKTMFAEKLKKEFGEKRITIINQDSYYKDLSHMSFNERCKQNFDHPDAIDFDLLLLHIKGLILGNKIDIPIYDFSRHLRSKDILTIKPKLIIIIDGTLLFTQSKLNEVMDIKIFLDLPDDQRLAYRIKRDTKERGRTVESIIKQYANTVRPMYDQFIYPSKNSADIIVDNTQNDHGSFLLIKNEINKILN